MARINGVDLPRDKRVEVGLTYLYGIGQTRAHAESVSRAELSNKDNWKRVYEPKQVRIVAFKHKLG